MDKARTTIKALHESRPELIDEIIAAGGYIPIPDWFYGFIAGVDLVGWTSMPDEFAPYRYVRTVEQPRHRLMVIVSGNTEADGKRWIHVSYSRPSRIPSYEDLCLVKDRFIGADRQAISVHPPASQHVNLHATCLHLFHCLDGDGLPDFRGGTNQI